MSIDLTGSIHGKLQVLSRHSIRNKQIRWNVLCLSCNREYDVAASVLKRNILGCSACSKLNAPKGVNSIYWRGGRYISAIFLSNVARGARKRNIECRISIEELDALWEQQQGHCAYTNRQLKLGSECTASLDRIDSDKGYFPGNIQFVHKTVNCLKWALPEVEFLQFIKEIYLHKVNV
jgi:hypothetical protein